MSVQVSVCIHIVGERRTQTRKTYSPKEDRSRIQNKKIKTIKTPEKRERRTHQKKTDHGYKKQNKTKTKKEKTYSPKEDRSRIQRQ